MLDGAWSDPTQASKMLIVSRISCKRLKKMTNYRKEVSELLSKLEGCGKGWVTENPI